MNIFIRLIFTLALLPFLTCSIVQAKSFDAMFPELKIANSKTKAVLDELDFKQGDVRLPANDIVLKVPDNYYFFDAKDAKKVLTKIWGNPADAVSDTLGMILPADKTPYHDTWGAILSYEEDGYVSDKGARDIDYGELLQNMQSSTEATNEARKKGGFPPIRLVGWASEPFYDAASHKLHWAKELQFANDTPHTLNYDVRALGRKGVIRLNFVASINDLATIKSVIPTVMAIPNFGEGARYADYIPGTDKVAAYGIGGLIAGKVLAKTGLLAIALVFLKKFGVFILIGLVAVFGWIRNQFSGRSG